MIIIIIISIIVLERDEGDERCMMPSHRITRNNKTHLTLGTTLLLFAAMPFVVLLHVHLGIFVVDYYLVVLDG